MEILMVTMIKQIDGNVNTHLNLIKNHFWAIRNGWIFFPIYHSKNPTKWNKMFFELNARFVYGSVVGE